MADDARGTLADVGLRGLWKGSERSGLCTLDGRRGVLIDGGECCIAEALYFDVIVPVIDGGIEATLCSCEETAPASRKQGDEHGNDGIERENEDRGKNDHGQHVLSSTAVPELTCGEKRGQRGTGVCEEGCKLAHLQRLLRS